MTITTAMCNSYKVELMKALHDFSAAGGSAFKLALIKGAPTGDYDKTTTNYSNVTGNSDETSGTGYTAGGSALTNVDPSLDGDVGLTDFGNLQWLSATFNADGCIIYNTSNGNSSTSVHDFGGTKTASGGSFDLTMPAPAAATAVLRLA